MSGEAGFKKVGVVGLGLIGGSLAAACKRAGCTVFGIDADRRTNGFARLAGSIDKELTDGLIAECDVILIAVPVAEGIRWIKEKAALINKDSLVIDCCGIKREICEAGFSASDEYGFSFMGGHPMAGKQKGGIKNSSAELFDGATFALVPRDHNDIRLMTRSKAFLEQLGFGRFIVMTPEEHDKVIAFTSQMAHLISNAYIKSDMAEVGAGMALAGGAFRDMTRVAYLDEAMWTDLFMRNRENLIGELRGFIGELSSYLAALESEDAEKLTALLAEGKRRKEMAER